MAMTAAEARSWMLSVLPAGFSDLMDVDNSDSDIYDLIDIFAQFWRTEGADLIDTVRDEFNPFKASDKLPDWEASLGLTTSRTTTNGTDALRQDQIIAKLRESGASTLPNIRAAIQPFVSYADPNTIEIVECDRSALRDAHKYALASGSAVASGANYTDTVTVPDEGDGCAEMGAHVVVKVTITADADDLTFTLSNPGATRTRTWGPGFLPAGNFDADLHLYAITDDNGDAFERAACLGDWTFTVANASGANNATIAATTSYIFTEAIGKDGSTPGAGGDGLGSAQFHWGVMIDPALYTVAEPDYEAIQQTIDRFNPAHCIGDVIRGTTEAGANNAAVPDDTTYDTNAIPNQCIPG